MKHGITRTTALLLACMLLTAWTAALPAASFADASGDIMGGTGAATTFFVYANGSGYIRLHAEPGIAYTADYDFYGNYTGTKTEKVCGFFRVAVSGSGGYIRSYAWAPAASRNTFNVELSRDLTITFPSYGDYKVVVTPLSGYEINNTYWSPNRFQSWMTGASWAVADTSGCSCRPGTTGGNSQPAQSGTVTVNCYNQNGGFIKSYTETLTVSQMIYPQSISGYTAVSSARYISCSGGICSPAAVTFYYSQNAAYQTVTVYCYNVNGSYIRSYTETLYSSGTLYPRSITGYTINSAGQYITISNGSCVPSSVTFYYRKNGEPTVTPAPATPAPATPVPAQAGSNPKVAYPVSWDTQFKPGTATAHNNSNAERIKNLPYLYDDNINTSFFWLYWQSERNDDIPEFTAYFDNATVSKIGVRNGNHKNSTTYRRYGRARRFGVKIYDSAGNVYQTAFEMYDKERNDYSVHSLDGTYKNVTKIELYLEGIYLGTENKYSIHVADIQFYK